jgi:hypothetical protein
MERLLFDQVDEIRNEVGDPEIKTIIATKPGALARVDADFEGEKNRIMRLAAEGRSFETMEDQLVAAEVIQKTMTGLDPNSAEELIAVGRLINSYRDVRSEAGRILATGYDPTLSPEERNNRFMIRALMTPPLSIRRRLDAATTSRELGLIWDEYEKQTRDVIDSLAKQGINIHALTDEQLRDKAKLLNIIRQIQAARSSPGDKVYEYWINAILSAPTTHVANIVGNLGNTTWDFFVQRAFESSLNLVTGNRPDRATFGEMRQILRTLTGSFGPIWGNALRRANLAWNIEAPVLEGEVNQEGFTKIERMTKAIPA